MGFVVQSRWDWGVAGRWWFSFAANPFRVQILISRDRTRFYSVRRLDYELQVGPCLPCFRKRWMPDRSFASRLARKKAIGSGRRAFFMRRTKGRFISLTGFA